MTELFIWLDSPQSDPYWIVAVSTVFAFMVKGYVMRGINFLLRRAQKSPGKALQRIIKR